MIPNSEGERTTSSVVAFSKDGERLVGTVAVRQMAMNSGRTVSSVKRYLMKNEKKMKEEDHEALSDAVRTLRELLG